MPIHYYSSFPKGGSPHPGGLGGRSTGGSGATGGRPGRSSAIGGRPGRSTATLGGPGRSRAIGGRPGRSHATLGGPGRSSVVSGPAGYVRLPGRMAVGLLSLRVVAPYYYLTSGLLLLLLLTQHAGMSAAKSSSSHDPPATVTFTANPKGVENQLIQRLLTNYSRFGRPISDVSRPVHVSISFYLTQLMSLEEKHQVLTTFGWLETFWIDEYLTWNATDFGGLTQIVLSPELVWLPDFGVENSAKAIYDELFFKRFRVSVTNDGVVNWVPGGKFITSCQLDITYYPFDDQECHIDLVDWAYHGLQVKLVNGSSSIGLDAFTESGEWEIRNTVAQSSDQYYESDPGVPFPRVRFTIYLRRKPMFYTINIITPCLTMSLLALLVFYLPPDSGEKVSLGITVLLSFSVFLLLVAENVPKTSEFVPLLGIYLTLIMAMTATSILICVVVLNLHHRDPNAPVPGWLRHLTYNIMARMVCMRSHTNHRGSTVYQLCEFAKDYAMTLHENHTEQDSCHTPVQPQAHRGEHARGDPQQQAPGGHTSLNHDDNNVCDHMCYIMKGSAKKKVLLEEVVKHLRQITCKIKDQDEQDSLKAEWKIVAKILDRFFLILFILIVIVSSTVLLFIYPLSARGFSFD